MKSDFEPSTAHSRPTGLDLNYHEVASVRRGVVGARRMRDVKPLTKPLVGSVAHPGIARTLRFMAQNYHRPIQVQGLTELAGLSRRGLFKAFLRHTGIRPAQVLRQFRIERAQELLLDSGLTLPEVAAQCGYRSVNSFWVSFRQVTGVSPGQYRKSAIPLRFGVGVVKRCGA